MFIAPDVDLQKLLKQKWASSFNMIFLKEICTNVSDSGEFIICLDTKPWREIQIELSSIWLYIWKYTLQKKISWRLQAGRSQRKLCW